MDCEDRRHLTVVGLHDTGPRSSMLSVTGRLLSGFEPRDLPHSRCTVLLLVVVVMVMVTVVVVGRGDNNSVGGQGR